MKERKKRRTVVVRSQLFGSLLLLSELISRYLFMRVSTVALLLSKITMYVFSLSLSLCAFVSRVC